MRSVTHVPAMNAGLEAGSKAKNGDLAGVVADGLSVRTLIPMPNKQVPDRSAFGNGIGLNPASSV